MIARALTQTRIPQATATFRVPRQITLGAGTAESIGAEAKGLGGRHAFIASSPTLHRLGITDELVACLTADGIASTVYTDLEPEPSIKTIDPCVAAARDVECDLVVGVGGGSVLDVAKVVAMLLRNDGQADAYLGVDRVPHGGVPSIMLPSTAGTGAEITPNALFYIPEEEKKAAIVSGHIIPDIAIVDPILTLSVPPAVTAATGMDALCHAIESYTSVNASPLTEPYALEAIRLIGANLRTAVFKGDNPAGRESMAVASLLASLSMASAGTNAVHALAYPLQGLHRIAHGVANSLLLPYVLEFNLVSNLPKFTKVAEALGEPIDGVSLRAAAERSSTACRQLSVDIGIPQRLSDVGITVDDVKALTDGAMQVTRLLNNNPRPVEAEDVEAIFTAAL